MLAFLILMALHFDTSRPVPTYVIPPSTSVMATTPIPAGTIGISPAIPTTPIPEQTAVPIGIPLLPPHNSAPLAAGTPQDVIIDNLPVEITGTVYITSANPLAVTIATPTENAAIPGLVYIFTLIMAKLLVLALYNIGQSNIFVKIYELLVTALFIAVDMFILYPLLAQNVVLYAGGLWFVFWLATLYIDTIINVLSNLHKWTK